MSNKLHLQSQGRQRSNTLLPTGLVILSTVSVQCGAALAKSLFHAIGTDGTVFLRIGFAALIFLLVWRPRFGGYQRRDYLLVTLFGLAIAIMNASFYAAIARIPLGIAVTLEFAGPLGVAIVGSREPRNFLWAGLAAAGILLLAPLGKTTLDPLGVGLALLAGACWAAYILLNARVGQIFPGGTGLAFGMSVAALVLIPLAVIGAGPALLHPAVLGVGLGVAVLASVIPFSAEIEALRRLPTQVFGVLMSLDPAIAAVIGFVILGESITLRALLAISLIMAASVGVSFFQKK